MSKKNPTSEQQTEFEQRSRIALQQHAEELDAATLSRLRQARSRALERVGSRKKWRMPAAVSIPLAFAALFAVLLSVQLLPRPTQDETHLFAAESLSDEWELLMADDEIAFYDDLDFVIWLDSQGHAG